MRYRARVTPGSTSWAGAALPALVAAVLLFLPGTVFARILGAPLLTSLSVAPAISTTILSLAGIAAGFGLPWGPVTVVVATVTAWLVAYLVARSLRVLPSRRGSPRRASRSRPDLVTIATAAGVAFTTVVVAAVLIRVSVTPDHFPQHPDTIYHLAASRWMVEHHDISVLHAAAVVKDGQPGFYPAALHGLVATTAMISGSNVVVAMSACVLVTAAVVWPLGLMLLARALFGSRPEVAGTAAVASVLFTAFPFSIMGFGVLWPNLFGQTLLPSTIALAMAAVARLAPHRDPVLATLPATVLAVACIPGLTLAHPNALITLLLVGFLVLAFGTLGQAWELRDRPLRAAIRVGAVVAVTAGAAAAAYVIRPPSMAATGEPGPELPMREALLDTLQFSLRHGEPLTLAAVLVAIGAVVILVRHSGARWVTAALVLLLGMFFANVAIDDATARMLTWPWYNNAVRLAAAGVLPAALAAAAGMLAIGSLLARPLRKFRWAPLTATTAVVAVFLLLTHGYVSEHRAFLRGYFYPQTARSWASDEELIALQRLSSLIPADAVTAANAWNGATYLYVVSGRRLLVPTEKALTEGDRTLLAARLDDVGTDPEVCAAARRQRVGYAITGGVPFLWGREWVQLYDGIDSVGESEAFRQVAKEGPYTLYKLTECAGS